MINKIALSLCICVSAAVQVSAQTNPPSMSDSNFDSQFKTHFSQPEVEMDYQYLVGCAQNYNQPQSTGGQSTDPRGDFSTNNNVDYFENRFPNRFGNTENEPPQTVEFVEINGECYTQDEVDSLNIPWIFENLYR